MESNRRTVTQEDKDRMLELRNFGKSYRDIGNTLGVSHTTVRACLVYGSTVEANLRVAQNQGYTTTNEYQSACRDARGFETQHKYRKALESKRNSRNNTLERKAI